MAGGVRALTKLDVLLQLLLLLSSLQMLLLLLVIVSLVRLLHPERSFRGERMELERFRLEALQQRGQEDSQAVFQLI
jgi:hypothetical protein